MAADGLAIIIEGKREDWPPMVPLTSQARPFPVKPRTPPTSDTSRASPPKSGVKPPGNSSRNEK